MVLISKIKEYYNNIFLLFKDPDKFEKTYEGVGNEILYIENNLF